MVHELLYSKKNNMKTLLITATSIGAAIAGIILYFKKSKKTAVEKNGFHSIETSVQGERNMAHTMG
jgi:hypothetical protein